MECDLTRVETNISYTEDVKDFLLKGNKDLMHPRVRDTNPRQLIGNAINQLLFDRVDVVVRRSSLLSQAAISIC